jgi:class 3 adenylate cyclase
VSTLTVVLEPESPLDPDARAVLERAGLFDAASPDAAERLELLVHLLERFTADEIVEWSKRTHVLGVAARALDRPPPLISAAQAAARAGVSVETVADLRQALGFPVVDVDRQSMPETVVDDIAIFELGVALYGREDALAFTRVVGWAAARVIEAARAMFGRSVEESAGHRQSELELSQANEAAIAAWVQVQGLMTRLMAEHPLRDVGFVHALMAGELRTGVAFVDLVGSTSWAESVAPTVHSEALRRFEGRAALLATEHGARLVKLIGDEAMLAGDDPERLCRVALAICELAASDPDLPLARGAVGFGRVTARDGDYFGPLVNTVARATKAAAPGDVVVTAEVARSLDPQAWTVVPLGLRALAGMTDPIHLSVVGRPSDPAA